MSTFYRELRDLAQAMPGAKPYHQDTRFLWLLSIDRNGTPSRQLRALSEEQTDAKGKVRSVRGIVHFTPSLKRTAGVAPLIPHDGLGYVLGWCDPTSKPERVNQSHRAWSDLIRAWAAEQGSGDPIARSLVQFLAQVGGVEKPDEWTSKDGVLLEVAGVLAHEATTLGPFWTEHVEGAKSSGTRDMCLICGEVGATVDTLPQPVKGPLIPDGQTSGVAPISINANAFGYNLTTGLGHVPVCTNCAQAIPSALNHLLADQDRTERTDSTATTWWVTGPSHWTPNPLLKDPVPGEVRALYDSVHQAKAAKQVDQSRWNHLVLAANGPRMIVKDWTNLPLEQVQQNLLDWFADIEIASRHLDGRRLLPIKTLATATGRHDRQANRYLWLGDRAGHHFHEAPEVLRAVALMGQGPPRALVAHLISRITSDQRVDEARVSLLRLCLRRTYQRGDLMPDLDQSCTDPCYVAGRLFAIYGEIQYAAATMDGGAAPNVGFADKHLAGAISDPRTAITAGEKQSAGWLNKLRRAQRDGFHRRDLDDAMSLLEPSAPLPAHASLDQQAMFILGYHHQRAHTSIRKAEATQRRKLAAEDLGHPISDVDSTSSHE